MIDPVRVDGPGGYALFNEDQTHRLLLTRQWGAGADNPANRVLWIMLNPSTADAFYDDPTIVRCARFARRWGYDGITVANLYSFRATKPQDLKKHLVDVYIHYNPADPCNDWRDVLSPAAAMAGKVVCGWGANGSINGLATAVRLHLTGIDLYCLGTTTAGYPRHPLYVSADTVLQMFT